MDIKNELREAELENVVGGLTLSNEYFDIMIELVNLWKSDAYTKYGNLYFGKIETLCQPMLESCQKRNYDAFVDAYKTAKEAFPLVNGDAIEAVLKTQSY